MKAVRWIKTAAMLLIMGTCVKANLLTNGDFEAGDIGQVGSVAIPGWSSWGDSGWHHNDAGATIDSKAMKFWWDSVGLWQDFEAESGVLYLFAVQVMDWSGDTSSNNWDFQIEAEFYDDSDTDIIKVVLDQFNSTIQPDDMWVTIGGTITAPENTAYGRVVLRATDWQEGISGSINFDNVSVIQSNDPDYNSDFHVDYGDYLYLCSFWQQSAPQYDLNGDSIISLLDIEIFAQAWLTWQMPADAETVIIDSNVTYQAIEGFGASLTDSSAWLFYEFLDASQRQAILTDLFDPNEGIGLSYLRQPMGASDFRLQEYSYDDLPDGISVDYNLNYFSIAYDEQYIIPTLLEILAVNPDVRIMGSPWSPPVWMKDSGQIGWGSLKSDVYDTYANYFVKYIQAYAAHGIDIDAVTLQNEPDLEPGDYAGCRMEPAEQIKLVKKMGPAFDTHSISTKILVWDHNWDNTAYALTVLGDPQAFDYIDGVAWHYYAGDASAQTTVHDAYPTKAMFLTEGSDGTWNDGGFGADLIRNGILLVDTMRNWGTTVIKWNLALDENNGPKISGGCNSCYGVVTINQSTGQVSPRPHYYALGHASKFIRPGATRIACETESETIHTVAFQNTDGTFVLYAVNSDPSNDDILKLNWKGQWVVKTMPAYSMMTLRWKNLPDSKVDVYLTTGDQTSLFERQNAIYFHD